jgi:ATP-dependent DNA helicase RecG
MVVTLGRYKASVVIRMRVEASSNQPIRLDGVTWVRPGPTTRRATPDDERVLTERRRYADGPFDARPLPGTGLDDLDLALFTSTYVPSTVAREVLEEDNRPVGRQLASLGLTDSSGSVTTVGLLTVGLDPSSIVPGAYVQFVRYAGDNVDSPISDDQEIRSNVIEGAFRLAAILRGHLHTRLSSGDDFRESDRPDYPFDALREVCMNAVMHRNYETSYAPVRISWFDDRIEVTNPGGPYGQVRTDNFDRVNDYRNPSLASAMKSLGFVNRFGRGIGRIRVALERNGNPVPEFVVDDSSWAVMIRRAAS